jgi:N-acetylmuramoyl-L-alanine amidase
MRLSLALFFLCLTSAVGQYSIEVRFAAEPDRSTVIGAIERQHTTYCSLNDIAAVFKLDMYINKEAQKIELKTEIYSIKATANNPFVILTDRDGTAHIFQLPQNCLTAAGSYFAPAQSFLPILDIVMEEDIAYESDRRLITAGPLAPAPRFTVGAIALEEKLNGTLVRIQMHKEVKDYESWLQPIKLADPRSAPEYWLYLTIVDATVDTATVAAVKPKGLVRQVLAFQSPGSVQLTLRLRGEVSGTELLKADDGNDLLLTIHTPTAEQAAAKRLREIERNLEKERAKWKLDVIVLDAGHGGKDPGTIGVARTKEKDVTLGVALKLGKLIQRHLPGVKVIYTRTTDEFIELYRRGQIANQAGGKLFISLHCNSMPRKPHPAKGFEIYLLRPGKTEHALRIAERENEVVKLEEGYEQRYQQLNEENFILLTMAQSAYVRYSELFADMLQQEISERLELVNNGVKQAGFYVLVGASMPNVLVETGYLSNREEERFLRGAHGQQRVAEAIFSSVKRYKTEYERSLEEGRLTGANSK